MNFPGAGGGGYSFPGPGGGRSKPGPSGGEPERKVQGYDPLGPVYHVPKPGSIPIPDPVPVLDLPSILEILGKNWQKGTDVHLVGLIFGRPQVDLVAKEIIPDLDFIHNRSKSHVDFFFIGFGRDPALYDAERFSRVIDEFETELAWKYSWETDLILLDAVRNRETGEIKLDFGEVVAVALEALVRAKAIDNARTFLRAIVNFAEDHEGFHPAGGFSDEQGMDIAWSGLKKGLFKLFRLDKLHEEIEKAAMLAVRDITRKH